MSIRVQMSIGIRHGGLDFGARQTRFDDIGLRSYARRASPPATRTPTVAIGSLAPGRVLRNPRSGLRFSDARSVGIGAVEIGSVGIGSARIGSARIRAVGIGAVGKPPAGGPARGRTNRRRMPSRPRARGSRPVRGGSTAPQTPSGAPIHRATSVRRHGQAWVAAPRRLEGLAATVLRPAQ